MSEELPEGWQWSEAFAVNEGRSCGIVDCLGEKRLSVSLGFGGFGVPIPVVRAVLRQAGEGDESAVMVCALGLRRLWTGLWDFGDNSPDEIAFTEELHRLMAAVDDVRKAPEEAPTPAANCPLESGFGPCECALPRCPECGYTEHDARFMMDHERCGGVIPPRKLLDALRLQVRLPPKKAHDA